MTDTTNDIDGLLGYLSSASDRYLCYTIPFDVAANYRAALTALVAERDGLKKERTMYWESCDALEKQTIDLKARVAALTSQNVKLHWEIEENPPADRDRELRKDLICVIWPELLRIYEKTDTTGANWDLVRINARAQALREADAMIAAMRKEEQDGK